MTSSFVGGSLHSCLSAWQKLTPPCGAHTLRWLQEGVRIPFASTPPSFEERNSPFNAVEFKFVQSEIKKLVGSKCVAVCDVKPQCVSRLTVVPKKGDEKFRLVIDLRRVNEHSEPPKFIYEDIACVAKLCEPGDHIVTLDIKRGFHQVKVWEPHTTFLGFKFENTYYKFLTLCFGLNASPFYFHKIVRSTIQHFRYIGIRIVGYVDDFAIVDTSTNIGNTRDYVLKVLQELGFHINFDKSSLDPSCRKTFIGYVVDTVKSPNGIWIEIPGARIRKVKHDISRILKSESVTARALARVAGQLVSMTKAILPTKLMLRNVYRLLSSRKSWSDTLQLDQHSKDDLTWWHGSLRSWNGRHFVVKENLQETIQIATDASGLGWGGHILNTDLQAQGYWNLSDSLMPSNFRELTAVLNCLKSFAPKLRNSRVQILTDNVTTAAFITFQGGQSRDLSDVARQIWSLTVQLNIDISAKWLAGKDNSVADRLSRVDSPYDWYINPNLFRYLDTLFGPHTVDRFACCQTAMCETYNSRYLDPGSAGVDALAQNDWGTENNWVNPPIRLIPNILELIVRARARATLIAPLWKAMSWTPLLWRLSVTPPVRLPKAQQFCVQMGHQAPEPTRNKNWKFYAWRLHGDRISQH